MKTYTGLWEKLITKDNFELAAKESQRGKKKQYGVKLYNRAPAENLEQVRQDVINGKFHTSKYKSKIIFEPKKRTIYMLPYMPDRIVQHAIMNVLIPYFERMFISDSYACINGRGSLKASQRCSEYVRRNKYALKCDIHHFYPSIDQQILSDMFHKKFNDSRFLALMDDIIFSYPGGKNTPIGNYTSQWCGNFYLTPLDLYIKHELKCKDYVRYCDDFILFSDDKKYLHDCRIKIEKFIKTKLKLTYSKADVFSTRQGVDFCGYRSFGKYVLLRKSTALRMKRKIRELPGKVAAGEIDQEKARAIIDSTYGWMKHANTYNLRNTMKLEKVRGQILYA